MKELIKKQRAFTLVELLVTVAITSILTTVVVVGYMNFLNKAAIATDEYLASQINRLIAGHRVFEKVEDENEIANVLKPNINPDVDIQTMKLDMNIYYNTDDKEFQVLKDVEAVGYENLHYYLSLNENNTNDFIDSNNTLIHLNNNFEFTSDISYLKQSTPQYLKAYKNNDSNQIIIEIWISGDSDQNSKIPSINLLETISLTDTFGNEIDKSSDVNFYCVETDLVEYRNHPISIEPYEINESSFIAHYPGTYTIYKVYI